tara:strand:+ start:29 stop:199 length:171 start_codon:yes stop_codon:yes gene_type:complete
MNIYKNNQGYLIIEDDFNGTYERRSYLYYSKQESIKKFKQEFSKYYYKNGHKRKDI